MSNELIFSLILFIGILVVCVIDATLKISSMKEDLSKLMKYKKRIRTVELINDKFMLIKFEDEDV